MPYPDNFSATAFRRHYGDESYDHLLERADDAVERDVARAVKLKAQITAFLNEIDHTEFETTFPAKGYAMEDLVGTLTDIRDGIDIQEYQVRATAIATEMAMAGDL